MPPIIWLPFGFLAGLAAGWLSHRSNEASQDAAEPPIRPRVGETRAAKLRRLSIALEPISNGAAHGREIAGEAAFAEMVHLLADEAVPIGELVDYAFGGTWTVACAAFTALKTRLDGYTVAERVTERFDSLGVWQMQYALDYLADCDPGLPVGAPLIGHQTWWNDNASLPHAFSDYFTALEARRETCDVGEKVRQLPVAAQEGIKIFLARIRHRTAATLTSELAGADPAAGAAAPAADPAFLASLGRFWGAEDMSGAIEPAGWSEGLTAARKAVARTPVRSLLVSGEPLVGKTSFLRLMGDRLSKDGWRVFEASGADLQAGQQYIGQLEGRIRQAVEELAVSRKIIWYVPDLLALALSGTHQSQSASILDQILPAMSAGRLLVFTEATPASAARLLQIRPALRRTLEVIRLEPLDDEETMPLARAVIADLAKEGKISFDADFEAEAIESARHYLSASSLPGSALALIKMTALRSEAAAGAHLTGRHVIETLAQLTGLPSNILDGSERIDLAEIDRFFSRRVMGQPEAVQAIVDRIAMLKSGLNDPMKPFGVFLFAGPTGTGKTELAKAIAEYLFGSVDRMVRLDMSEYQTADTVPKLIGGAGMPAEADTLISRIRKQPFSLILLDEFEKSNPHIWDLFLQVFDEGRLTDAFGQTADFRHCLIILTTNLGATKHQSSGLGFAPLASAFTEDQVMRTISQTFRPEFQNRLDKVIVFKPLTRELMRGILKKELDRLYERRGLKDRGWAVEWEASALEFLLEKGFSPDMGARPLKRAIDQFVVAPLASAIVERRTPEGEQFVFARSDGTAIQAEFLDPDGDGEPTPMLAAGSVAAAPVRPREGESKAPTLGEIMLAPEGTAAEVDVLGKAATEISGRLAAPEWAAAKSELSEAINSAGFWSRADRFAVLARYELMDRVAVAAGTLESLNARLARGRGHPGPSARELMARLAMQAMLVRHGLADIDEEAPIEVALTIEPVADTPAGERGAAAAWRTELSKMYEGWCRKRNMSHAQIEGTGEGSLPIHIVSGFGSHRVLAQEVGLHVLEQSETAGGPHRIAARVMLVASPVGEVSKPKRRSQLAEAFAKSARTSTVVRRYRREPAPLVRNADGTWRSGKLEAILAGDFDLLMHEGE